MHNDLYYSIYQIHDTLYQIHDSLYQIDNSSCTNSIAWISPIRLDVLKSTD